MPAPLLQEVSYEQKTFQNPEGIDKKTLSLIHGTGSGGFFHRLYMAFRPGDISFIL